jgi:transcriptional regulator with XRE-family HTH domain
LGSSGQGELHENRVSDADLRTRRLFAYNLKRLRAEAGLTLRALSELSGVGNGRISELETASRSCNIETIGRLAEALEVPVSVLFDEKDFDEPTKRRKKR